MHYYWDACVFIAHLNDEQDKHGAHVEHIQQFLDESRNGQCTIYTSSITIAEIPSNRLKSAEYGTFAEFLDDFQGSIIPIGADPNVMAIAAQIRGLPFVKQGSRREVGTPDAIHLASALVLTSDYGVPLTAFHTFDNGKSKMPEGKTVSLLALETWCDACRDDPLAKRLIALSRIRPLHSDPRLPLPASAQRGVIGHRGPSTSAATPPPAGPPNVVRLTLPNLVTDIQLPASPTSGNSGNVPRLPAPRKPSGS